MQKLVQARAEHGDQTGEKQRMTGTTVSQGIGIGNSQRERGYVQIRQYRSRHARGKQSGGNPPAVRGVPQGQGNGGVGDDAWHLSDLDIVRAKRIAQPVDPRRLRIAVGLDHIEPAWEVAVLPVLAEEALGGVHQFAALADIHRSRTAAEGARLPIANFDEYQRIAIASAAVQHHQIQLAAAIVRVGRHFAQTGAHQRVARGCFGQIPTRFAVQRSALSRRR